MMKVLDVWHFFFIPFHLYDVMNSLSFFATIANIVEMGKIISFPFGECKHAR